jgi:hypothetical protein
LPAMKPPAAESSASNGVKRSVFDSCRFLADAGLQS